MKSSHSCAHLLENVFIKRLNLLSTENLIDISPLRRVYQAIWLLCTGTREASLRNIKSIAECLADELINAAKGSFNR